MSYPVTHSDIARFYEKTRYNPGTTCLEWTACRMKSGHGQFSMRHKLILAHRWIMQLKLKRELKPGEVVRHDCDNPPCVALHHLQVGTQKDNVDDMNRRGRNGQSNKTHCRQGHEYTEGNTYWMPAGGRDCKQCVRDRGRRYKERKRRARNTGR